MIFREIKKTFCFLSERLNLPYICDKETHVRNGALKSEIVIGLHVSCCLVFTQLTNVFKTYCISCYTHVKFGTSSKKLLSFIYKALLAFFKIVLFKTFIKDTFDK